MKKSFVSLLTMAAFVFGMASCNNKAKQAEAEAQTEQDAVIAGEVSKNLLTEELKQEVSQYLKDMPSSDLPYKISIGEIQVSVANTDFMLPVSKASELTTQAQKARACGIYFADLNILKAIKKPTSDVENVLVKLATDLNIPFVIDIMKESAPAGATKEELNAFLETQEDKLIEALTTNDKIDIELEILGGMTIEYACLMANPGLVVKGDAISAGLSDNMVKRQEIIKQEIDDLAKYYPDLGQLSKTIQPLEEMTVSIGAARAAQQEIEGMRTSLLQ